MGALPSTFVLASILHVQQMRMCAHQSEQFPSHFQQPGSFQVARCLLGGRKKCEPPEILVINSGFHDASGDPAQLPAFEVGCQPKSAYAWTLSCEPPIDAALPLSIFVYV